MSEKETCRVCRKTIEGWKKDDDLCEQCQSNLRIDLRKYDYTKTGRTIIRNWVKGYSNDLK